MSDWQPIETAPKDGTKIDLWMIDEKGNGWCEPNAYWVSGYDVDPYDSSAGKRDGWFAPSYGPPNNYGYDNQDGWCDTPAHTHAGKAYFGKATHWMPTSSRGGSFEPPNIG